MNDADIAVKKGLTHREKGLSFPVERDRRRGGRPARKDAMSHTLSDIIEEYHVYIQRLTGRFVSEYSVFLQPEDREDIIQNIYEKLLSGALDGYKGRCSLKSYIFIVARSCFLDYVRNKSFTARSVTGDYTEVQFFLSNPVDDIFTNPARTVDEMQMEEIMNIIRNSVGGLKDDFRLIFRLVYEDGMSQVDAARMLGLSASTVSQHLAKILRILREELEKTYPRDLIYN